MANYIEYKVKKGDTLYEITKKHLGEEKAKELYQQYLAWRRGERKRSPYEQFGYGGVAERLPIGTVLRLPQNLEGFKEVEQKAEEITSPQLPAKPQPTGKNSITASFLTPLSEIQQQFQKLASEITKELKPTPEVEAQLAKERELTRETIQREAEMAREKLGLSFEEGMAQLRSIRQQLYGPVNTEALKELEEKTNRLYKNYQLGLERINEQEKEALLKGDVQYAKQLRQLRLDYLSEMLKLNQEYQNTIFRTLSALATQQRIELEQQREARVLTSQIVKQAESRLSTLLESYKGQVRSLEDLPENVRDVVVENALVAGIPLEVVEHSLTSPEISRVVNLGDRIALLDKRGNVVRVFQKTTTSATFTPEDELAFNLYLGGKNVGNKLKMGLLEEELKKRSPFVKDILDGIRPTALANLTKKEVIGMGKIPLEEVIDDEINNQIDIYVRGHIKNGEDLDWDFVSYLAQADPRAAEIFQKATGAEEGITTLPSISRLDKEDLDYLISLAKEIYLKEAEQLRVKDWLRENIQKRINLFPLPYMSEELWKNSEK